MRLQVDRVEDSGMAILLLYPEGRQSIGVPRELLPKDARAGEVLEAGFAYAPLASARPLHRHKRLLDDLLGRDG